MRELKTASSCLKQTWFFIPADPPHPPLSYHPTPSPPPPLLLLCQPTGSHRTSHLHCFYIKMSFRSNSGGKQNPLKWIHLDRLRWNWWANNKAENIWCILFMCLCQFVWRRQDAACIILWEMIIEKHQTIWIKCSDFWFLATIFTNCWCS